MKCAKRCEPFSLFFSPFILISTLWGSSTFLILQRRKLRFWKVKSLAPGHTIAAEGGVHTWGAGIRPPSWDVALPAEAVTVIGLTSVHYTVLFRRLANSRVWGAGRIQSKLLSSNPALTQSCLQAERIPQREKKKKKERLKRKYANRKCTFPSFSSLFQFSKGWAKSTSCLRAWIPQGTLSEDTRPGAGWAGGFPSPPHTSHSIAWRVLRKLAVPDGHSQLTFAYNCYIIWRNSFCFSKTVIGNVRLLYCLWKTERLTKNYVEILQSLYLSILRAS